MNIDSEQLEDWLDEHGYITTSTTSDLESRLVESEAVISALLKQAALQDRVLKYAIQRRIDRYEMQPNGSMILHMNGEAPKIPDRPSIFDRIEEIIKADSIDDPDQPWLN